MFHLSCLYCTWYIYQYMLRLIFSLLKVLLFPWHFYIKYYAFIIATQKADLRILDDNSVFC